MLCRMQERAKITTKKDGTQVQVEPAGRHCEDTSEGGTSAADNLRRRNIKETNRIKICIQLQAQHLNKVLRSVALPCLI